MKHILLLFFTFFFCSGYAKHKEKQPILKTTDYCILLNMALDDSMSQRIFHVIKDQQLLLLGKFCTCIGYLNTNKMHRFVFFLSKTDITDTEYYEIGHQNIDVNNIRIGIRHYPDDAILILHFIRKNEDWICNKRNYGNY